MGTMSAHEDDDKFHLHMVLNAVVKLQDAYTVLQDATMHVVSPASLLDSQHGCITSPHVKKESGQTPYAVWSPLVQEFLGQESEFDCCGVWFYSSLLTVRPHLLTVQDQTAYGV